MGAAPQIGLLMQALSALKQQQAAANPMPLPQSYDSNLSQAISGLRANPTPMPTPDPMDQAVQTATEKYPWLKRIGVPIKLTSGTGPYMDESYLPDSEENPHPGAFTVQLRNEHLKNTPSMWPDALARESIDYLAQKDPVYQATAKKFRQMMTPDQLKQARKRIGQDPDEKRPFETVMRNAELQEWIGGYVLDMPGWKEKGGWTPKQRKLLDGLKQYLWQGQKPVAANIP